MPPLLQIRAIMNSSVEDVFAFRTCCSLRVFDQNLEVHITNLGEAPVTVRSYCDLKGEHETLRVDTLMPQGDRFVAPGQTIAFYCTMDEKQWENARQLVFYDTSGNPYAADIC